MEEVVVSELIRDKMDLFCSQRLHVQKLKEALCEEDKKLKELEKDLLSCMDKHGLDRIHSKDFGTIYKKEIFSVRIPKTPTEKKDFFEYLKHRGLFESLVTINSQTLNAWYREELRLSQEMGRNDFGIPGLTEISTFTHLSVRKA